MAKPAKKRKIRKLSPEIREAVAREALSGTKSHRQVAKKFGIDPSAVLRAIRKAQSGQFTDLPRSGRPKKLSDEDKQRIKELAELDPDRSIRKIKQALEAEGGPSVSKTTVSRTLHETGFLPLEPEKIQLKPGLSNALKKLSESLDQFEETKRFADNVRRAVASMLPHLDTLDGTGSEGLSKTLKETSAKYGAENENGRVLQKAGEVFSKLAEEERTYADYVKRYCLDQLTGIDQDSQIIANVSNEKDLQTVTEEMFVAKRKLRNAKTNRDSYREQAQIATKAFQERKEVIEHVAPKISQHRQKQREAIKTFIEAQRVFYLRAVGVIESALPFL